MENLKIKKNKTKHNPQPQSPPQNQALFQSPAKQLRLENLLPNYYVTSYWIELTNISSAFLCFRIGTSLLPFGRTGTLARLLGTALIDNFRAVN